MPPYVCLIKNLLEGVKFLCIKWNENFFSLPHLPLCIHKIRLGIVCHGSLRSEHIENGFYFKFPEILVVVFPAKQVR
jgi:hypothetical protein